MGISYKMRSQPNRDFGFSFQNFISDRSICSYALTFPSLHRPCGATFTTASMVAADWANGN